MHLWDMSRAEPGGAQRTFADDFSQCVVTDDAQPRRRELLSELAVRICKLRLDI